MWTDQAIFTSLARDGMAGYHVVARSEGVSDTDANALATWSPSHGALIVDAANATSVNFHPLPGGRFALSRTLEGRPEYSGRGKKQLYTHALFLDLAALRQSEYQPIALYRHALSLGHFRYRPDPDPVLKPVSLSLLYTRRDVARLTERAKELKLPPLEVLRSKLAVGEPVRIASPGDRIALAECLLGLLDPDLIPGASFSTSLHYSSVRPYWLSLVGPSK
jgi:hypothetical protein